LVSAELDEVMAIPVPADQPLTIPDVFTLDAAAVRNNQLLLSQLVQEAYPNVDVKQGTLYNLLFFLSATLTTANQAVAGQLMQSMSLAAINANPALATDAVVNNLLSNFQLTRLPGVQASGPVQITLSSQVVMTIPQGTVYTANGVNFTTDAAYTTRTDPSTVLSVTDKLLTPVGNGTYVFTVNMTAQAVGAVGNLTRGTRLVPTVAPSPVFVQAQALTDFSNGVDQETNAQLVNRLYTGVALKAWSNRMNVPAMLQSQAGFRRILSTSVIGYGDQEMVRDQHSIWPGSLGGRVDLYVRTQGPVASVVLSKKATLVATATEGGIWQFSLGRDEVPGFYDVGQVAQAGTLSAIVPGYPITSDTRSFDLTNFPQDTPDIVVASEAGFSRYQTTTIRFNDTDTLVSAADVGTFTRTYDVLVRYMPLIDQVQDFLRQRGVAPPGGDVLVKAPVPLFITVSFNITLQPGVVQPSVSALQAAAAAAVNGLGFGVRLTAAVLSAAITPLLPPGSVLSQVSMTGKLRHPEGNIDTLNASDVLVPVYTASHPMTSQRTVGYFLTPSDVSIVVATATDPQV
jgi:hypothetical protein